MSLQLILPGNTLIIPANTLIIPGYTVVATECCPLLCIREIFVRPARRNASWERSQDDGAGCELDAETRGRDVAQRAESIAKPLSGWWLWWVNWALKLGGSTILDGLHRLARKSSSEGTCRYSTLKTPHPKSTLNRHGAALKGAGVR
jgi:hypothetical protein